MDNSLNNSLVYLFKYMFMYLIFLLIEGKYRISVLNDHFDSKYINFIKFSSNVNMIMTSLFVVFVLIIILAVCYFVIELSNFKISMNSVIQGFVSIVFVFIVFQLLRLVIDIFMLQVPNYDFKNADTFVRSLEKTRWFKYLKVVDFLMIAVGTIVFSIKLYLEEKGKAIFEIFVMSSIFLVCYIIVLL